MNMTSLFRASHALLILLLSLVLPAEANDDQLMLDQSSIPAAEVFSGDLDQMVERRVIRALVPYSPIFFFVDDKARPRGISQDYLSEFEQFLNQSLEIEGIPVSIAAVPVTREQLIPWLLEGRGDLIVADLTITDARSEQMQFSEPIARGVSELLISGPSAAPIRRLEELAGRTVLTRVDSSYLNSLNALSTRLVQDGLPAIDIELAPGHFEDGDLLEVVNAGIAAHTVIDGYMARYWQQALPNITVHDELKLREDSAIGWAIRTENHQLKRVVDEFVRSHRDGTLFGNITIDKYLKNPKWITNPDQNAARARFNDMAHLFQTFAQTYELDWLLLVAQGYQESTLDQTKRSHVGAIGVMQLLQSTADDMDVGDIMELENNIHAGVKYVRYVMDHFFNDPAIDQRNRMLLALASYNAGPGRIRSLRRKAAERGLDPNQWFDHVEIVVAQDIGRETVNYVRNIFKYYIAYRMIMRQQQQIASQPNPGN